jgi:predicted NBD/HSP70 family sugar kinase
VQPVSPPPAGPALAAPSLAGTALTLVHTGQARTRSDLTSLLGVTRGTTGAIAGELRDLGLVEVAAGPGEGQQGRPSHRLLPDPAGPVALAAQVHPDGFAVALVGLGGTVVARRAAHARVPADPRQALAPVAAAGVALLRASGRRCVGAAVAVPAAVTRPDGTVVRALYVGWPDGAPVRDIFAAELARRGLVALPGDVAGASAPGDAGPGPGVPGSGVAAVNDVNAVALAEHRHGAGRGSTHLLVVAAEHHGVGGALVQHGTLYAGSTGLAMEAGHVSVDARGRPCVCGNRGCLNVEADAARFLDAAGHSPAPDRAIGDEAVALLRAGYPADPRVRASADAVIARLGLGLAGLINVVNPDLVLLGGLHRHLLLAAPAQLRAAVAEHSPWGRGAGIGIQPCALDDAGLIGAAEVAWQPVLDNPALLRGVSQ